MPHGSPQYSSLPTRPHHLVFVQNIELKLAVVRTSVRHKQVDGWLEEYLATGLHVCSLVYICLGRHGPRGRPIIFTSEALMEMAAEFEVGIVAERTPSPPGFGVSLSVLYVARSKLEELV